MKFLSGFLTVLMALLLIGFGISWYYFKQHPVSGPCTDFNSTCSVGYTCRLYSYTGGQSGQCISLVNSLITRVIPPQYTCPKQAWVDCLPGPDSSKPECQPDYLEWASQRCPDFEGVSY